MELKDDRCIEVLAEDGGAECEDAEDGMVADEICGDEELAVYGEVVLGVLTSTFVS